MKSIVCALFVAMSGCAGSALEERLSTDTLWEPDAKVPSVSEHPIGIDDHFGIGKRMVVANPLNYPINVKVVCASMFMDDPVVHVAARSQRYILMTAPKSMEDSNSCVMDSYEAAER